MYNYRQSEEGLMEKGNISLKILLGFFKDPFLEVNEIESMRII